ncbi:hypothetical protein [Ralstonia sp. ASV6]|uniref:hypothetical protein n=1 Tax=Ralstonia sp. ASV6 TaxID=2795124 RepID=UPI0018EDF447|nr:hypothetical protein [Ralstonia sp. ASV6]
MSANLTPPQRRALSELWRAENLREQDPAKPKFPGAIGHAGKALERRGLVRKLGPFTYQPGFCFMRFQLTDVGRQVAAGVCVQTYGNAICA